MAAVIPLLYSSTHQGHAPQFEFYHGRLLPYLETPNRIEAIKQHLLALDAVTLIEPLHPLPKSALLKVHDPDLIACLEATGAEIDHIANTESRYYRLGAGHHYLYPNMFAVRPFMNRLRQSKHGRLGCFAADNAAPIGVNTWQAALYSATLAWEGANLILRGEARVAYALCRPPGHHAGYDFISGYCYLNNAAVAAAHLLELGKVAVLDVDYHHGNGTQAIFWDEPRVLYGSIHAHPEEEYPYYSGFADETGSANAPNTTINLPLLPGAGTAEFMAAFDHLLERTADFQPSALVLSLGFDAFEEDPLSTLKLTRDAYRQIGAAIMRLGLPVLMVQEGGYQTAALAELAECVVQGLRQALR